MQARVAEFGRSIDVVVKEIEYRVGHGKHDASILRHKEKEHARYLHGEARHRPELAAGMHVRSDRNARGSTGSAGSA